MIKNYKKYNSERRGDILNCSLSIENAASWAIITELGIYKDHLKTLGNKSTSLSLKNKIDLLHDLGELSDGDYKMSITFMEIRNQFIHNPDCNDFSDLESYAEGACNSLKKYFPAHFSDGKSLYAEAFEQLWRRIFGKLLTIKLFYVRGYSRELRERIYTDVASYIGALMTKEIEDFQKLSEKEQQDPYSDALIRIEMMLYDQIGTSFEKISPQQS